MIIKNGLVLTNLRGRPFFVKTDIRVIENKISEISENLSPNQNEEIIDARDKLVMPGLINSHSHSYTNILKGTTFGSPLELWSLGTVALGGELSADEMALSAQLGVAEMLHLGITGFVDHIPHPKAVDKIAEVYKTSGIRAAVAPMLHDISDHFLLKDLSDYFPENIAKNLVRNFESSISQYPEWIKNYHKPSDGIAMVVAPNSPQRATSTLLLKAGELAEKYNLAVHAHLLETTWQRDTAISMGENPVAKLFESGLLTDKTSLAHSIYLTDQMIEMIAQSGATVVHNPTSNGFIGSGIAPVSKFLAHNIPIAFGSDGSNCATNHNMLEIARTALMLQRISNPDYKNWLSFSDIWRCLTVNGGNCLGSEQPIGEIKVGALADIIICEKNDSAYLPEINLEMQTIINSTSLNVLHSIINGKVVMKDKKILTFNEPQLFAEVLEHSKTFAKRFDSAISSTSELEAYYSTAYESRLNN